MPSNKAQILVRTSNETKEKLTQLAEQDNRSLSNFIEVILENYIKGLNINTKSVNIGRDNNGNVNM